MLKNCYKVKHVISDTDVGFDLNVPLTQIIKYLQSATFTHSDNCGLDHGSMVKFNNAFWVITQMKVKMFDNIRQFDEIEVKTWTHPPTGVRVNRDFSIKNRGKIMLTGCAEWCCLDWETRKIRRFNTIKYPKLKMVEKESVNLVFSNMREKVDENNFVYKRKVMSTDIDVNMHTNNLRYSFFAFDAFSVEELSKMNVEEYEIYFVNESKEGDEILVYKKQVDNYFYVEGKSGEKTIFRSVFKLK